MFFMGVTRSGFSDLSISRTYYFFTSFHHNQPRIKISYQSWNIVVRYIFLLKKPVIRALGINDALL